MYYKEEIVNGILCWRGTPKGKWKEFSKEELTARIDKLERALIEKTENLKPIK